MTSVRNRCGVAVSGAIEAAMLSVVLTSYNYARFLPAALAALAGQVRPADEMIIIDDGSDDESVAIIAAVLDRFAGARLIRNPSNLGTIGNLNRGLELARGEVVYFAAADDIVYPFLLARGMELLEAHPQAALFSARSDIIDATGRIETTLATAIPLRRSGFVAPAAIRRMLLDDDTWLTGNTTLYRRAPLAAAGGFAAALGSFCDGYVSRLLAARDGACFSPEVLGAWRRHEGGYAWSQTADFERSRRLAAAVTRQIAAEAGSFPPGYARRWAGRHLFGARRFALVRARQAAVRRGPGAALRARFREIAMTLFWFLAYRPRDLLAVIRRRLRVRQMRAGASYRAGRRGLDVLPPARSDPGIRTATARREPDCH